MKKIAFEKENTTISCVNGKLTITSGIPISDNLIKVIENENNFKTINHTLNDLRINHMIDEGISVVSITLQDNQTQETVSKAFEEIKKKHNRLFVLFQRLLECAEEAKKQEQKSANAKKGKGQCNEDHEGMYYQQDGTFQKEINGKSIGLCIISNYKEDVIMSFGEKLVDYKDINKKDLPSYLEMITAIGKFKIELILSPYKSYWACSPFEFIAYGSYVSDYPDNGIGCVGTGGSPAVRNHDNEFRLFRKVWRISKI